MKKVDPTSNYSLSLKNTGYKERKKCSQADYDKLGLISGLEIHQQLKTKHKLFCQCPSGIFQTADDYDAEIVRHMRPTLSELGEYDGTALMEFKTRKEITYRIKDGTACTYDIDDTPPFPINQEAVEHALEYAILLGLNIVGELHVARKQYLDGSIPTGFQRTGIIGIEGVFPISNKKIRIIQLSIEEDSCREVSDIGHKRIYRTDRLGTPLVETVTYPDMTHPDEVQEAAHYLRYMARATSKMRTGSGAARQDVNVSITGGTRIEIKGVASISKIPDLVHIEAFRQKSLLVIKDILNERIADIKNYKITARVLRSAKKYKLDAIQRAIKEHQEVMIVNLPHLQGILSHFNQPDITFADEFRHRLKVIACLEHPNMCHSEETEDFITNRDWDEIRDYVQAGPNDAQIIFWGPKEDIKTALDTIQERIVLAYNGVPNETRKALTNGITIFERVLPGANRMYPDTDSAPIPLATKRVEEIKKRIPQTIDKRFKQLTDWKIPHDAWSFLLRYNLIPIVENIINKTDIPPKFVATTFAHQLKNILGKNKKFPSISDFKKVQFLFEFIHDKELHYEIAWDMLKIAYIHPKMDFNSILIVMEHQSATLDKILGHIPILNDLFTNICKTKREHARMDWIMGQIRKASIGNIPMKKLNSQVENVIKSR